MVGMKKKYPRQYASLSATGNEVSSMNQKEGFDMSFGPSRLILKFIGVWPDKQTKKSLLSRTYFLVPAFFIICFINLPQTVLMVKVWGNLNAVLEILTTYNISSGMALFKMLGFWYNRDVLEHLKLSIAEDWNSKQNPEDLRTMWRYAKLSRLMSIIVISLAEGTIAAQIIMAIYVSYIQINQQRIEGYNASDTFRPMFITAQFFYDVQSSPQFELTWIFQSCAAVFAASAYASTDAFFTVLMLHLCSQLNILRRNLRMLSEDTVKEMNDTFTNILSKIVKRHEFLYNFANEIESVFNLRFLVQIITSSIIICLQGYALVLITTNGDGISPFELIFMLYFILCIMFSVFGYCYVAEVLRIESSEIGSAAYESDWYNMRTIDSRQLILIMVRARQPFTITAGKFSEFSLNMFCSILRTSGGYLSMLLAMKDRLT